MRLWQQDHKKGCECKPNCRSWAVWPNEHFLIQWLPNNCALGNGLPCESHDTDLGFTIYRTTCIFQEWDQEVYTTACVKKWSGSTWLIKTGLIQLLLYKKMLCLFLPLFFNIYINFTLSLIIGGFHQFWRSRDIHDLEVVPVYLSLVPTNYTLMIVHGSRWLVKQIQHTAETKSATGQTYWLLLSLTNSKQQQKPPKIQRVCEVLWGCMCEF